MIECEILPDGLNELPTEARDDSVLASYLSDANSTIEANNSIGADWRDVERIVPGDQLTLRVPGSSSDYENTALNAITDAVVGNISGVKKHPDGWTEQTQTSG